MTCLVCQQQRELCGAACAECLAELEPAQPITPEQVKMRGGWPTTAVLVDPWGRPHQVQRATIVGRQHDDDGLLILDATISRRHASLAFGDGAWLLTDLESSNGTYVDGVRIAGEARLGDGARLRFGDVSFFFLDAVTAPPDVDTASLGAFTVRPQRIDMPAPPSAITIVLREPTGGGGGMAVIDGKHVQLTLPQLELMSVLHQRGDFVTVAELLTTLSLDSADPNEDHVRQLVRRLRRVLARAGIIGLIESRYGAGYRLALLRP